MQHLSVICQPKPDQLKGIPMTRIRPLLKKILLGMERDLVQDMSCKTHPNSEHAVPQNYVFIGSKSPTAADQQEWGLCASAKTTTTNNNI